MLKRAQVILGMVTLFVVVLMAIVLGTKVLRAAPLDCGAASCSVLQTTTTDFVRGAFYATGLRKLGDGEVQLLPVGLSKPWKASTALPVNRAELDLVSNNNILYAIGGYDGTNYHTEIYSATTSLVGDITTSWATADNLPLARAGAVSVIAYNPDPILYVIGGGSNGSSSNTIYYKKIDSNGALSGSWSSSTLPANVVYSGAVVRGTNLYVIGGGANSSDVIYRLPIQDSSGSLGSAVQDLSLPQQLRALGAVTWFSTANDFLYVLGGLDNLGNGSQNVFYTNFNSDGSLNNGGADSGWNNASLVDAFNAHGAVQYNGAIYVIGGKQGLLASTAITKVQTALIDPDGSLHNFGGAVGNWIVTEPLPVARFFHGSTVNQGGELFIAGGYDSGGNPTNTVYHGSTTGSAATYAPNGTFTGSPFDIGPGLHMTGIQWNASVADTSKMSLALYYRASNDLNALTGITWTLAGLSAQSTSGFTNTLTFPTRLDDRYLQYRADYTTTISDQSPSLNAVELDYAGDPTPTPTVTNTPPPSLSLTPSLTPTFTDTWTPAPPTATDTPTSSPTLTLSPTNTGSPTATLTPTDSPTVCLAKPGNTDLVSPNNASKLTSPKVMLAWNSATCATKYKVLVQTKKKHGSVVFKKTVTDIQVLAKRLKKGHKYVWRVQACNTKGCGKWSGWWKFGVKR